jgi:hypothetical protein
MNTDGVIVIFALVAAVGLLGLAVVETQQQAEAKSVIGECATSFKDYSAHYCHEFR